MDDFLHNLRSGKLKQPDRGRRDHTDYKGPQRRTTGADYRGPQRRTSGIDRRQTDYYAKVTNEHFALIKDALDVLSENQKRIADTIAARNKLEARITNALEALVSMIDRQWNHAELLPQSVEATGIPPQEKIAEPPPASAPVVATQPDNTTDDCGVDENEEPSLIDVIAKMRAEGDSWEKIARHFNAKQIPTISGKGTWRGPAVKKFWNTNFPE